MTWVFCKVLDPLVLRISCSSESWQGLNPLIPRPTIQAVKSKISLFNSLISMIKNVSLLSWASKMPSFPFWNFFFFSRMKKELKMFNPENVPFSEAPKKRFNPTKGRLSSQPSHKKSVPNFFYSHFFSPNASFSLFRCFFPISTIVSCCSLLSCIEWTDLPHPSFFVPTKFLAIFFSNPNNRVPLLGFRGVVDFDFKVFSPLSLSHSLSSRRGMAGGWVLTLVFLSTGLFQSTHSAFNVAKSPCCENSSKIIHFYIGR